MRVKSTANYFNCASQVGTLVTYANLHTSSTLTCFLFLTKSADHIPTVFFCVIKPVFILGFTKKSPLHLYCTYCMFSSQGYRSRTMALLSAALNQSADCVYPVGLVDKTTAAEQWRCNVCCPDDRPLLCQLDNGAGDEPLLGVSCCCLPVCWLDDWPFLCQLYNGPAVCCSWPISWLCLPVCWLDDRPLLCQLDNGAGDEPLLGVRQPHLLPHSAHPGFLMLPVKPMSCTGKSENAVK